MLPGPAQARSTTNGPGWSIDATKTCASMPAPVAVPLTWPCATTSDDASRSRLGTGRIATTSVGVGEEEAAATDPGGEAVGAGGASWRREEDEATQDDEPGEGQPGQGAPRLAG